VAGIDEQASLVAIGNIHGQGELLLEQLATLPAAPVAAEREPRDRPDRERPRPTPYPRSLPGGRVPVRSRLIQPNAPLLPRTRPGRTS
jgi:hypothetical protein